MLAAHDCLASFYLFIYSFIFWHSISLHIHSPPAIRDMKCFCFLIFFITKCNVAWQAKRKRQEELEKHKQEEHQRKQQVSADLFFCYCRRLLQNGEVSKMFLFLFKERELKKQQTAILKEQVSNTFIVNKF